jgi:hypothetical protein
LIGALFVPQHNSPVRLFGYFHYFFSSQPFLKM